MLAEESSSSALLDSVVNGTELGLSPDVPLSLEQVRSLAADTVVEAKAVRDILIGAIAAPGKPPRPLDPRGLRIRGAWIRGELNLDGVDTKVGLRLTACRLDDPLTLRDASLRWLELDTCVLPAVIADRAQLGMLTVRRSLLTGEREDGTLRLAGAHVTRQLRVSGTQIDNPEGPALMAPGLTVDADAFLDGLTASGTGSEGTLCLSGATVGGDLVLRGTALAGHGGPALLAENLTVKGNAFCCDVRATGEGELGAVRLAAAAISGRLSLRGTTLANDTGPALVADRVTAANGAFLDQGFTATGAGEPGAVRLPDAKVGVELSLQGATLANTARGPALWADDVAVQGDAFLGRDAESTGTGEPFRAYGAGQYGTVRLVGASVTGTLWLGGASLNGDGGPALMAANLSVQRTVRLDKDFDATGAGPHGTVCLVDASIGKELILSGRAASADGPALNLTRTSVGTLSLDRGFASTDGGSGGLLEFDGLTYSGLPNPEGDSPTSSAVKLWLSWFRDHTATYAPQPYQQLAAAYKGAGYDDVARSIFIAQRDDACARGNLGPLNKIGQRFLKYLISYGYRSILALVWLVVLFVITALISAFLLGPGKLIARAPAATSGQAAAATAAAAAPALTQCSMTGRIGYAIELSFPVINLNSASGEQCDVPATGARWWVVAFGWLIRTLAAVLLVLYSTGITGLARSS
jgi:hypothetical protein